MLDITFPEREFLSPFDNTFITVKETTIQIEHSLLSISKWESKYMKSFLGGPITPTSLNQEEFEDYVKCMTLTKNVNPKVYFGLTNDIKNKITDYMNAPMTATTFSNNHKGVDNKIITSEIIYYDMIMFGIPFECQKWHLNRLMALIKVCSIKNSKPEKIPRNEMLANRRKLNAQRLNSRKRR